MVSYDGFSVICCLYWSHYYLVDLDVFVLVFVLLHWLAAVLSVAGDLLACCVHPTPWQE